MHKLLYLPLARQDLQEIVDYMTDVLAAPKAASDFLDALETALQRLREHPYSCRVYQPMKEIDLEYRLLVVKRYLVFYIASEDTVEIHRVIYGRQNLPHIMK